jgi:hypothetical protein
MPGRPRQDQPLQRQHDHHQSYTRSGVRSGVLRALLPVENMSDADRHRARSIHQSGVVMSASDDHIPASVEMLIARSDDVRVPCLAQRIYSLPANVQKVIGELIATRLRIGGLAEGELANNDFAIVDTALRIAESARGNDMPKVSCTSICRRWICARAEGVQR